MRVYVAAVLLLCVCSAVARISPVVDVIAKLTFFDFPCRPLTLPSSVQLECYVNSTFQIGANWVYCNCSADNTLIHEWYANGLSGVYTYVTNFSTNVCTPSGAMYVSARGACGGGEPYDAYAAHALEAYIATTQTGSSWPVNANLGAGLVAVLVAVFAYGVGRIC
jgi:hypothetical protein